MLRFKAETLEEHCKEVYYKVKSESNLPVVKFPYTIIESYDYLQEIDQYIIFEINPFRCVYINFNDNDFKNIKKLINNAKSCGFYFVFFNNSNEGIEYFNTNELKIYYL
jgi:hypothetical protein